MHDQNDQLHQGKPCNPDLEKSRELQRKLYLAAKRSRNRRFHALYDRVYRPDVLWRAYTRYSRSQALNAAERRLSESRVRENCMHGLMWQEMETRAYRFQAPFPDPDRITRNMRVNSLHHSLYICCITYLTLLIPISCIIILFFEISQNFFDFY